MVKAAPGKGNRHLNRKQRKTLDAIFGEPVSAAIKWQDIETLLIALGCERKEGNGSRVRFRLDGVPLHIHRPHPAPNAKRHVVRSVRAFLEEVNIKP